MENRTEKIWTRSFVLLFFGNLMMALAFYFLIAALPLYIKQVLSADESEVGIVLSAYTLAALLIRPLAGMALDRYGRKWIFLLSLLVFALLFNVYLLATSLAAMMAYRFLHGIAWGVTSSSSSTVVVDIIPVSKRGEGIGYFGISMTLGMALGPMLGMFLLEHTGYEGVFVTGSLLAIVSFIAASLVRYPAFQRRSGKEVSLISQLFELSALPASVTIILLMATYGSIIGFISLYGDSLSLDEPGMFFVPFAIGIGIARILAGRSFDRHGPKTITLLATLLIGGGFFILSLIDSLEGYLTAGFLLGVGNGMLFPTFQAVVNNLAGPHRRGAANSTFFTAVDLGIGAGLILAGAVANSVSLPSMFAASGCLSLVSAIPFLLYTYPHYRKNYNGGEEK